MITIDIQKAESNIKKLLSYVEDLSRGRPRLYRKSKDRLRTIANSCSQMIMLISEILQDETLMQEEDVEFSNSVPEDVSDMMSSIVEEIAKLKDFVSYESEKTCEDNTDTANNPVSVSIKLSRKDRIDIMKTYQDCLSNMCESLTDADPYNNIKRCVVILRDWFFVRFIQTRKTHPSFRYNIRRIREWIPNIVIVMGKHVEDNTFDMFSNSFYDWVDLIRNTEGGNKYAVPYEVYKIGKEPDPTDFTLTAVVLWDVLIDLGFQHLCKDPSDIYLDENIVYDLCSKISPSTLDNYVNFKNDPSILIHCNLEVK